MMQLGIRGCRYNTIRWIVHQRAYAVGHPTNPYTGEIYDVDIRIAADFISFL